MSTRSDGEEEQLRSLSLVGEWSAHGSEVKRKYPGGGRVGCGWPTPEKLICNQMRMKNGRKTLAKTKTVRSAALCGLWAREVVLDNRSEKERSLGIWGTSRLDDVDERKQEEEGDEKVKVCTWSDLANKLLRWCGWWDVVSGSEVMMNCIRMASQISKNLIPKTDRHTDTHSRTQTRERWANNAKEKGANQIWW